MHIKIRLKKTWSVVDLNEMIWVERWMFCMKLKKLLLPDPYDLFFTKSQELEQNGKVSERNKKTIARRSSW